LAYIVLQLQGEELELVKEIEDDDTDVTGDEVQLVMVEMARHDR
jgi:hypothetical protein